MSDSVRELLVCLAEEASEVVQAVTKTLRHGPRNHHPDSTELNVTALAREVGEFEEIRFLLVRADFLDPQAIAHGRRVKNANLSRWLHGHLS